jgi:predicted TIM-barrel fold metal-dependent hydrolase
VLSPEALYPYLPAHFREYLEVQRGQRGARRALPSPDQTYPSWLSMLATDGAALSFDRLEADVLRCVDLAILNCYFGVETVTHPDLAAALATAVNSWLQEEWLARSDQLLGSAVVTPQHTEAAVHEIRRVAADPRFVQIVLPARSSEPYGHQRYWPIWEAADECGLAVALTYGGASGTAPTLMGWLSSFFELYAVAPITLQTHLLSIVASGILNRNPSLRVSVLESGWTWLPGVLWRFDEHWRGLHHEVPWLQELPSSYVRRHFRFTTHPIDAPPEAKQLRYVLDQLGPSMLLFASDYPHLYEQPVDDLLAALTPDEAEHVLWGNALDWYRLDQRPGSAVRSRRESVA